MNFNDTTDGGLSRITIWDDYEPRNNYYPEYYFSKELEQHLNEVPYRLRTVNTPPTPPTIHAPIKPENGKRWYWAAGVFGVGVTIVACLGERWDEGFSAILFYLVSSLWLLCLFIGNKKQDKYSAKMRRYEYELYDYETKINEYHTQLTAYEEWKDNFDSIVHQYDIDTYRQIQSDLLDRYRQDAISDWGSYRDSPIYEETPTTERVREGPAESILFQQLEQHYYCYQYMRIPFNDTYFYPDIVLITYDSSLFIDIEIDEPYSADTRTPIHYLEGNTSIDSFRNDYFRSKGWEVIRFSEDQVINHCDECIAFVKQFIEGIKRANQDIERQESFKRPKWSYDDCYLLIEDNYRDSYLRVNSRNSRAASATYEAVDDEFLDLPDAELNFQKWAY